MLFPNLSMSRKKPGATTSIYPAPQYSVPASNPSLQTGMEAFTPTVSAITPSGSAPVITKISFKGKADRVVNVAGYQFTNTTSFLAYAQGANGSSGFVSCTRIPQAGNQDLAKFILPDSIPANSYILVWPVEGSEIGYPLPINHPFIKTSNTDSWGSYAGVAGGTCHIGGDNLSLGSKAWIQLEPHGAGTPTLISATVIAPGLLSFTVPSIPVDLYDVWVHSEIGGIYGWHTNVYANMRVADPAAFGRNFPTSISFKPYTDAHGGGPGSGVDIATALTAAIADLNGTGGIINAETGDYSVSGTMSLIAGGGKPVRFNGTGKSGGSMTRLVPLSGYAHDSSNGLFSCGGVASELSNLKVDFTNGNASASAGTNIWTGASLRNVVMDAHNLSIALVSNASTADGVIYDGCDFLGGLNSSAVLGWGGLNNSMVRNCTFRKSNTPEVAMNSGFNTNNVLIMNTTCEDYTPGTTSGGGGRFANLAFQSAGVTIYNCTTNGLNVSGDANRGEQVLLADGGGVMESALSTGGTLTTVKVLASDVPSNDRANKLLQVAGGKGVGQYSQIASSTIVGSEKIYTIYSPFLVATDDTSFIVIANGAQDIVISSCIFDGDGTNTGASTTIEIFGPSSNVSFHNNRGSRLQWSCVDWALASGGFSPAIWNDFRDNVFDNCNYGPKLISDGQISPQELTLALSLHVDNVFTNINTKAFWLRLQGGTFAVIDHMTLTGTVTIGMYFSSPSNIGTPVDIYLYKCSITRGGTFAGSFEIDERDASGLATITQNPTSGQFIGFQNPGPT